MPKNDHYDMPKNNPYDMPKNNPYDMPKKKSMTYHDGVFWIDSDCSPPCGKYTLARTYAWLYSIEIILLLYIYFCT
mgnify:FL=1